ncbi:hypothetical protein B0J18DRAFT_30163 [Chaetomium sp. MPI-SDFR-AT-0129]|nr:hypothetical protein B0J18DRAFT_30163 [Chaetomium sp. MPI-SDFR-AT-0129]
MPLKQAFTPPPRPGDGNLSSKLVHFRHSAYSDCEPDLLCLSALDGDGSGDGIDYDLALTSCCIVTGNTFATGWLAVRVSSGNGDGTGDGPLFHRVDRPGDGILRRVEYHFCVGKLDPTTYKYPVVPSFDHWRFPHGHLPSPWKDIRPDTYATHPHAHFKSKAAALIRDGTCRISGYCDAVEVAHLVPLADGNWFRSNRMERYCSLPADPHPINDERNLILLRRDLHHLFDTRRFTFVAKSIFAQPLLPPAAHAPTAQLALHVMLPSGSDQLPGLYHNRTLQDPVRDVAVEFLFARFAWTLFTDENMPFFNGFVKHAVLLYNLSEGRVGEETLRSAGVRSHAKLFESYSSSRSISPWKRPRSSQPSSSQHRVPQTDAEAFETGSCGVPPFNLRPSTDGDSDGEDWDASDGDGSSEEPWTRGRRRKRGFETGSCGVPPFNLRPSTDGDSDGEDWDASDGDGSSEEPWTRGRRRKRGFETLEPDDYGPPSLGASFISASDATSVATAHSELPQQDMSFSKRNATDGLPEPCSKRPRSGL